MNAKQKFSDYSRYHVQNHINMLSVGKNYVGFCARAGGRGDKVSRFYYEDHTCSIKKKQEVIVWVTPN